MTDLLHTNDKFATVHNKCSKNLTANFNALRHSCVKNVFFFSSQLIFTLFYSCCSIQNASQQFVSCIHFSFENFTL